jgi:prolyl oligopeptidase
MDARPEHDPFLWLEKVHGARALAQVREWSAATEAWVCEGPAFRLTEQRMRARLEAIDRVAYPVMIHGRISNFWTDHLHPRGIWRQAEHEDYLGGSPRWRTLIDLDELALKESSNWVWGGAVLPHEPTGRAMIALSSGGADAVTWREFDIDQREFVPGGFSLTAGKTEIVWLDRDTLLCSGDFGPDSLTTSGYPTQVRRWRRGSHIEDSEIIARVAQDSMLIQPVSYESGSSQSFAVWSMLDHYQSTIDHLDRDCRLHRWPLPPSAEALAVHDGMLVALLHDDVALDGRSFAEGSLVAYRIDDVLSGVSAVELIAAPPPRGSVCNVLSTASGLLVHTIEDVQSCLSMYLRDRCGHFSVSTISVPPCSSLLLGPGASDRRDFFYRTSSFLDPATLHYVASDGTDRILARQPSCLDPDRYVVSQEFATSPDQTRIPYFLVMPRQSVEAVPVLVQAYGGFRAPILPTAVGPLAESWLEAGRPLVVANIRGGGEYGPAWHRSAIRDRRQRAFDDLHAVVQSLRFTRGISKVAIEGSCNGGLLAGVALTQRPDLYDAVVMGSPLTDMRRYHRLLAGASWIAEYGDPDDPGDWSFLKRYSPYHNLRADRYYPPVLLVASRNDDRVHPGHARKMAALLELQGHKFNLYEHAEGGHYCAVDSDQAAHLAALQLHWLEKILGLADKEASQ